MTGDWPQALLGDLCSMKKGTSPTLRTEAGRYPLVVTASYRRSSADYQFDTGAVCVPLISSTGHGNAAIHRIHYQDGKFALANLLVAVIPRDDSQLSAKFLWRYLSAIKDRKLVPLMQGTANVSLREQDLETVPVPLPPIAEQLRIVDHLDAVEARLSRADSLREQQEVELLAALRSSFHALEAKADWVAMGEVAPLVRREIQIDADGLYPELGIRSFGRGTFHKPAVLGVETSKRLFEIRTGDLVFSNVFAWEGAVAVAQPEDDRRLGSHRFISCVCDRDRVLPDYLQFYFLTPDGLEKLGKASPGGAGRNRTLGIERLAEIKVPLAPIAAQLNFKRLLDLQVRFRHLARQAEQRAAALLPSVLHSIFGQ